MRISIFMLITAMSLVTSLGISACVQVPEEQGVVTPPIVKFPPDPGTSGTTTVAGIDADGNGLRDDVQILIENQYAGTAERAAATQLAKSMQTLLAVSADKTQSLAAAGALNRAIDCLYSLGATSFGDRVDVIEGAVVNTEARARAYAKAGTHLSGGTFSVSTVGDNAAACEVAP
jgi:hypothetical protein